MKKLLGLFCALIMIFAVTGCGDDKEKVSKTWSNNESLKLLPEPEVEYEIKEEGDSVTVTLESANRTSVLSYVESVKAKEFVVDATTGDHITGYSYKAKNKADTHTVTITFENEVAKIVISKNS